VEGSRVGVYRSRMCSWFSAMNVLTSSMYLARRALACAHAPARSRALACACVCYFSFSPNLMPFARFCNTLVTSVSARVPAHECASERVHPCLCLWRACREHA
jgi:hypothetical protein